MIIDKFNKLQRYRGLSKNMDGAIDFLQNTDLCTLPIGKTVIDGENVFVNHFQYETSMLPGALENHIKYLDLHLVLDGTEKLGLAPVYDLTASSSNIETDFQEFSQPSEWELRLGAGEFALVFPGEGHIPKPAWQQPEQVDKIIVKILWEGC